MMRSKLPVILTVLKTTRPAFLVLTPVCVFLGLSTAIASGTQINLSLFLLILTGAIAAHISVNTLNEYYDFKSGLDLKTEKTPFSGGSGALPDNPGIAKLVLATGLLSLLVTSLTGIYLFVEHATQLLPLGLTGIILIITYTHWLNRTPLLCLVAPGLGFGVLMVVGTHVVLTGGYSPLTWLASLVPFFLVNNLLLLNQYPGMEADASAGRKTFPIVYGIAKSNIIYALFFTSAYTLIFVYIFLGYIPRLSAIALAPVVLSLISMHGANKYAMRIGEQPRYLVANVAASILTPLLLGIGIISNCL